MKRVCYILILTFLLLAHSSYAQDYLDIRRLCAKIASDYSIKVYFGKFPKTSWKIDYDLATKQDYEKLYNYLLLFDNEFAKYPQGFLKKTKLSAVVFVKSLALKEQLRTAIPDYGKEILILDFLRGDHNSTYQKHVIHHEFYHMIEEEFNRSAYWKDPDWKEFNASGVDYGQEGKAAQGNSKAYLFTHPKKGFVNLYSKSAIEEDKAEIYATLFVKEEYDKLMEWVKKDKVLSRKMSYMIRFLKKLNSKFSKRYFTRLHKSKKEDKE